MVKDRGAQNSYIVAITIGVIVVSVIAVVRVLTIFLLAIAAAASSGVIPRAVWISPDSSARFDFSGEWHFDDGGRRAFVIISPDGTVTLSGWPRDVACNEERTESLVTKEDLDWQNPIRIVGKIGAASDASRIYATFDRAENVCASQQTFFVEVNTQDDGLRLLRFINGATDEEEGIEPLAFYRGGP